MRSSVKVAGSILGLLAAGIILLSSCDIGNGYDSSSAFIEDLSGGEVTLTSGTKVTIPQYFLTGDATVTVRETASLDVSAYSGISAVGNAVKVDLGGETVEYGKTITLQIKVSGDTSRMGLVGLRDEAGADLEFMKLLESGPSGYVTMGIWFDGTFQVVEGADLASLSLQTAAMYDQGQGFQAQAVDIAEVLGHPLLGNWSGSSTNPNPGTDHEGDQTFETNLSNRTGTVYLGWHFDDQWVQGNLPGYYPVDIPGPAPDLWRFVDFFIRYPGGIQGPFELSDSNAGADLYILDQVHLTNGHYMGSVDDFDDPTEIYDTYENFTPTAFGVETLKGWLGMIAIVVNPDGTTYCMVCQPMPEEDMSPDGPISFYAEFGTVFDPDRKQYIIDSVPDLSAGDESYPPATDNNAGTYFRMSKR